MVLKQGEGYKPRGKTSVIVGTSKMQFHLPLEAEPGQAWAGKQEAAPMSMGTLLHGALPRGSPSSPQGAKELALSCKSSSGKHLQVPSQWRHCPLGWLCTSLLSQQQPTWVNPVSNLTWGKATPALPCPALPWACGSTGAASRRDGLSAGAGAAQRQTGLSRWSCAPLHPRAEETFLLSGMECLESQYLQLFARGCWQRYHWRAVIYRLHIYLHLCLKKSGDLPELKVLNQIWWAD